jgi:hypothetical protein
VESLGVQDHNGLRVPARDPEDNLISWRTNEGWPAEPPSDRGKWVDVIRATTPHRGVRVVLTTDDREHWRVSIAEEFRVNTGSGHWPTDPIDHKAAVTDALRKAGKPVRD